ncbi:MAG: RNA pyrophosphohydrolase [Pseudomonadota bacterium]
MALSDAEIEALPYRPCVGCMLLNGDGRIWAGQRLDAVSLQSWQMPQGGIDDGESPSQAVFRELYEETGIAENDVRILRESAHWRGYDFPRGVVDRVWRGQYRGQSQRWFALRFVGDDDSIRLDLHEPEFQTWAWMDHAELIEKIVPFKRGTYTEVFDEFAQLIGAPA